MVNYVYNGTYQQNISMSGMLRSAASNGGGPTPRLTSGPPTTNVAQQTGIWIPIGAAAHNYVAIPLITCAAVLFASTDPAANAGIYLYHALSGTVSNATIGTAIGALGNPPLTSIIVVYTFPNPTDASYQAGAQGIVNYGIPAGQVVYAPNLPASDFGAGTDGFIGL